MKKLFEVNIKEINRPTLHIVINGSIEISDLIEIDEIEIVQLNNFNEKDYEVKGETFAGIKFKDKDAFFDLVKARTLKTKNYEFTYVNSELDEFISKNRTILQKNEFELVPSFYIFDLYSKEKYNLVFATNYFAYYDSENYNSLMLRVDDNAIIATVDEFVSNGVYDSINNIINNNEEEELLYGNMDDIVKYYQDIL